MELSARHRSWGRWPILFPKLRSDLTAVSPVASYVIAVVLQQHSLAIFIRYHYVAWGASTGRADTTQVVLCPITAHIFRFGNIANSLFACFGRFDLRYRVVPTVRVARFRKCSAQLGYESRTPTAAAASSASFGGAGEARRYQKLTPLTESAKAIACIRTIESDMLKRTLSDWEGTASRICVGCYRWRSATRRLLSDL